jgi:surface protein
MKTTLLGIKFNILDLDAKYEVIGTSDNYSFQYELGKGRDLIGQENYQYVGTFLGSEYSTSIDLLGNYGTFLVKVFAVSDLGIRSEFISSTVDIEAPRFDGTFSFGSIQVADKEDFLESKISKPPTPLDNELVCSSSFSDNSIVLEWKIVPPPGHTEEGVLIGNDIVNDPFFDRFEVSIRNGVEEVLITEDQLNASVSLVSDFSTVDVASHLNNYKKCSLNLSSSLFDELDLDRSITVEIKCFDSFGQISSGKIYLENQKPAILNFNQFELKNKQSFSWIGEDSDYKYSKICYIGIVSGIDLPIKNSVKDSVDYFNEIALAQEYQNVNNKFYKKDDIVRFENYIFQCKVDHYTKQNGEDTSTSVEAFWEELFISPQFIYREVSNLSESFEIERMFGYNYFFEIVPYDGYGEGDVYSLTETGLFIKTDSTELAAFGLNLFIGDTTFRERGEDLVFSWKFFDHLGNKINLSEYTSISRELGHPEVLGVQGVLFDSDSREVLASISEKGSSILADGYGGNFLIPNLGIIDNFEYTRKINNTIYGTGGFPAGVTSFDEQYLYTPDGEVTQTYLGSFIFSSNIQNSIDSNSPRIKPIYDTFNSNQTYLSSDDSLSSPVVDCDGSLYKVIKDFGPESIFIKGLFNETLSYSVGDLVACPKNNFSIFNASRSYEVSDLVSFDGRIYICAKFQSTGNAVYPNVDDSFWLERGIKSSLDFAIFECLNDLQHPISQTPNSDVSNWQIKDPKNAGDYFEKIIDSYGLIVGEWSEELSFTQGNLCVYNNDIWIALDSSGPFFDSGFKTPEQSSAYWSNLIDNSDITTDHSAGDLVFYNGVVYKCLFDNPTGPPLSELKSSRQDSHSNYEDCGWSPFWILDDTIEYSVFGHVGIPEGGKRNVGLRLNLVSYNGEQMPEHEVIATNPPPRILPQGFSVDSTSMASRVRFNFNYDQGFQEKTTKVNLYRSSFPDFDITGSDKFPLEHIGADSTFVKSVLGAGDATFGDNITEIFDDPPLYVNSEGIEEATGYYYKILPFDDFGSGDLFGVNPSNDGGLDKIIVYPKNFHSQNPTDPIGEIPKASQPNLGPDGGIILYESIPGPAQNLTGDTAFVNYFLNWDMPTSERDENDNFVKRVPNDIDYYEIWESTGKYINYSLDGGVSSSFLNQTTNLNGYRRIIGDLESYGDVPLEAIDIAESIVGAKNIFDVDARSLSLETTYKGEVNDRRYFWVRPVDFAGNKGPFTGAKNFDGEYVEGLELTLGQAKTTDIADFEQNITKTFPNTVALVPNNPFKNQDPNSSSISWESHYLYNNGTGYYISAGSTDDKFLYFTGSSLELTEDQKKEELKLGQAGGGTLDDSKNNPLRNVVFTGDYDSVNYHPAGQGQGTDDELPAVVDDSDFIIARNVNGIASPMWHAFANALIGSAHIENAAITNAKIHNLTADKIRSAEIKGQDIQVGLGGGSGQIRSAGFDGLADTGKGFVVSGDGSFVFAADDGRLHFDDGELVLEGKLKQVDGKEYTFIDLDASPDSFFYSELSDGTYVSDGPQTCEIRASFQNSFVQENQVRFRVSNPNNGYEFIKYSDFNDNPASATYGKYDISGFKYDPTDGDFVGGEPKVATAEFNVDGFNQMINTVDPQLTTIIVSASGLNTSTERSIPINFVADGAAAVYVELAATQQVFEYDSDGNELATNSDPTLTATTYNADGLIYYNFISGGLSLQNSVSNYYQVTGIPEKFEDMPIAFSVDISGQDDSAILASDRFTFFGTHPGKDSYTVFLTNENHTYPAQENGQITSSQDLVNGGTEIKFFRGTLEYTYSDVGGVGTFSTGEITSSDPSNVEVFIDRSTADKPIIQLSKYEKESNEGTLTIPIYDNQYYPNVEFSKTYTFSKSIEGAKARKVDLLASKQAVKYNTAGKSPSPEYITLTANAHNTVGSPSYNWTNNYNGTLPGQGITSSGPSAIFYVPEDKFDPITIKVEINEGGPDLAADEVTIYAVQDGSDVITAILSNEAHSFTADSDGNVSDYGGGQTSIQVFQGATELNFSIADVGSDASKYNVAKTEGGINAGNLEQQPGSNGCRTSSVSNMASNSASIDFTITGRNDEGIEFGPINKVQTFSKSIAGEGEIGNRGVGVVFRGLWEPDKIYIGATETSDRGDVVFYDDGNLSSFKYWMAQEDHTSVDFTSDKLAGKWESFGAEFESVATDLLLAKDAVITHTLTMGQGDTNDGTEYVGHGGLIKTVGKEFGNGVTGFFLGNTGNPPNPQFDVGGESSFIRFDGDSDRVEIKGSLIINSRDDSNLNINSINGEDATFIGGGYNNSISGLGSSIVGGGENDISGRFSFIGGGFNNNMGDNFSAIVAGYNNEMPNTGELHQGANLIGAGIHNIIDGGTSQTIVNGSENLIQQTGNVGDELVAFDGQQGWLSPGFLGTFSGYGGGSLTYNKSANFVDGLAGWVENSWWPSYKKDWGVNTLSNVFYIGNNRGISESAWVYHTDLKWCLFSDQSSEVYNDAEYRIYNSLYGKAYPNKDAFYIYMAGFDPDFQDFYFWYKDEGISLAQSGGSSGPGIMLYRSSQVDANTGWYFLKKDNNSEIKLYHFDTQQWHSPISVSVDTDGDGVDDYLDLDDDGDGIPDVDDDFPLDSTEDTDTDGDNIGDNADTDDDNDGTLDVNDDYPLDPNKASGTDTDGDGQDDEFDEDDDNDGVLDVNDDFSLDSQQAQTIAWNNDTSHNLDDGPFSLGASTDSGLTLSYASSNTSIATVDANGLVTPLTGGAFTITISAPANASYFAASLATSSITVIDDVTDSDGDNISDLSDPYPNQQAQTITWNNTASRNLSGGSFSLGAFATSGLALSYTSSNTSIATVDANGLVTPLTGGAFTITISAPANASYFAASLTTASITVIDDVTDTDGDGVVDLNDNFPNNPNRASGTDTDSDGIDDEFEIFTPASRAELKTAVDEWIEDEASAVIKYGDINTWNVSNVTNMWALFMSKINFNSDISNWDVSNVTNMSYMFNTARAFNQDISSWDTSSVVNMYGVFSGASVFNQDISGWNVSNVNNLGVAFHRALSFNQDISSWDTSSVTDMSWTFKGAESFDQNIGNWNFSNTTTMNQMFAEVTLSTANYDAMLNAFKNSVAQGAGSSYMTFSGGWSKYSSAGQAARNTLGTTYGWNITDGGLQT